MSECKCVNTALNCTESDNCRVIKRIKDKAISINNKDDLIKSLEQKLEVAEGKVKELDNTIFGMHTTLSAKDGEIESLEKEVKRLEEYEFMYKSCSK